jgi:hypothetical protein
MHRSSLHIAKESALMQNDQFSLSIGEGVRMTGSPSPPERELEGEVYKSLRINVNKSLINIPPTPADSILFYYYLRNRFK